VNRKRFEHKIGEALRLAESAPPVGAWDAIKSQIPSTYTSPFKFPTLLVVAIAATMLGGMTFVKTTFDAPKVGQKSAQIIPDVSQFKQSSNDASQNGSPLESVSHSVVVSDNFTTTSASDLEDRTYTSSTFTADDSASDQPVGETSPTSFLPKETLQPLSTKSGMVHESARGLNIKEEIKSRTSHPSSDMEPSGGKSFVKEFSVIGANECFTPCQLNLQAKGNADNYLWEAGVFGAQEGEELDLFIEEPQTVVVFANAKYRDGSEEVISHKIEVKKGSNLFIPNSFTPNGDGLNDSYKVTGDGIVEFSMTIVNSRGKVLYQTTDMTNAWSMNGVSSEMEGEVFIAVVRARGIDGKSYEDNVRLRINP